MTVRRVIATAVAALAAAAVTLSPVAAGSEPIDNTTITYDTTGERLDAHDGDLLQTPDGSIYLYGTSYGCGFTLGIESPYCGAKVYRSRDLQTWTPVGAVGGYAFDHQGDDWQDLCQPPEMFGCYRPHVVQRPSDGKYVMWVNIHGPDAYKILVADRPEGPFEDTGTVPDLGLKPPAGPLMYGDHDLFVDSDGKGYVVYTIIYPADNRHDLVVEELDPTLTTGTGRYQELGLALDEAPGMFRTATGKYHIIYSAPAKPYVPTGTGIMDADSPLGPWHSARFLSHDSCMGQPTGVWPIKGPSGATTYVYGTDRWVAGQGNQYEANNYYGRLTFNAGGGAIDFYGTCEPTWTLP